MGQQLLQVSQTTLSISKMTSGTGNENSQDRDIQPFSDAFEAHVKQGSKVERHTNSKQSEKEAKAVKQDQASQAENKNGKTLPEDQAVEYKDVVEGNAFAAEVSLTEHKTTVSENGASEKDNTEHEAKEDATAPLPLVGHPISETALLRQNGTSQWEEKEITAQASAKVSSQQQAVFATIKKSDSEKIMVDNQSSTKSVLRPDILHAINQKTTQQVDVKPEFITIKEALKSGTQQLEQMISEHQKKIQNFTSIDKGTFVLKDKVGDVPTLISSPATILNSGSGSDLRTTSIMQPVLNIQPVINSEAWGKVLNSRLVWMAKEGVHQAELRLSPANLGPVEVKIHMHHDQANIMFVAHHASTRDALEQALPRLRDSFQENGMNLVDANVSDQTAQQQAEDDSNSTMTTMGQLNHQQHDEMMEEEVVEKTKEDVVEERMLGVSLYA